MINLEKNKAIYITFLALLASTPPLSTDMYLAAIPQIADGWGVGKDLVNLTLVLWFASFSVFILVAGSLSDKYGRKPVLSGGLAIFVTASFLCAFAQDVNQLIIFRILQGMGAAAPSAIVMAIIRDKFEGRERHQAMAYVMTIVAVAPMVAPIIGAMLLEFFSWRFIFGAQGTIVCFTLLISFSFKETIGEKITTPLSKLIGRYMVHIKNREFMFTNISMGLLPLPFYGFIAFSPIYYISIFGLSERTFSLLFGLNALSSMIGAFFSSRLVKRFSEKRLITLSIVGTIFAGAGVLLLAREHYLFFLAFMSLFSFCMGISRPLSGSLIIGLVKTDVGSASSFMVFYQFISGAVSMAVVTLHWKEPVLFYGAITLTTSVIVLLLWGKIANRLLPSH
jgi:DHA1 family bicyclomycin/chloramphenicol resistance-like MFS transporter